MYIRKSEDTIRKEIQDSLFHYEALIEAWKKVEIKKKKDGSEYKELTKSCLVGAIGDKIPLYQTNNANGYIVSGTVIKISTHSEAGYINDSIQTSEEWKNGMDEARKIQISMRVPFQYNTAEEIREKIKRRIKELEKEVYECNEALNKLHEIYSLYVIGLRDLESRMKNNCNGNRTLTSALYNIVDMNWY